MGVTGRPVRFAHERSPKRITGSVLQKEKRRLIDRPSVALCAARGPSLDSRWTRSGRRGPGPRPSRLSPCAGAPWSVTDPWIDI